MKEITGNLITLGLAGDFEVIIHGCNCFNTMGSGVAAQNKTYHTLSTVLDY